MSKKKKRRKRKYKTLLDENDQGGANVIEPSSKGESLTNRLKKETEKKGS